MEPLFILLSLGLSSFATADQNAEVQCNIKNYKDFIKKPGIHNCNLQGADLWMRYLRGANLQGADLTGANLPFADLEEADLQVAILHGGGESKNCGFSRGEFTRDKSHPFTSRVFNSTRLKWLCCCGINLNPKGGTL